jgi:hypothetical protein
VLLIRWERAPFVRIYERCAELTLLGADGAALHLEGQSAILMRVLLETLRTPRTEDELLAHVAELAGTTEGTAVVSEALHLLKKAGAVVGSPVKALPEVARPRGRATHLALALTGGIVAAYAPALVELLTVRGFRVRVAATRNALRFVSALALEALTHERVTTTLWPDDARVAVPHLELARWADVTLVYPATATTLSRIARGDCSTIVSALATSARPPVVLVPAMNEAMLRAPAVQRNLEQLRTDGFWVTYPCLGFEVAEEPEQRAPTLGAAPPVAFVVDMVEAICRRVEREGPGLA